MFAALINQCGTLPARAAVREMLETLAIYADDGHFHVSMGWGAPSIPWQYADRASMNLSTLQLAVLSATGSNRCMVGVASSGTSIKVGDALAEASHGLNDLTVQTTHDTAVFSARRLADRELWLGWYHDSVIDLVLAHEHREAIEAATGRCGCLFDRTLQMYLVPKGKLVLYGMGTDQTKVLDAAEAETISP